MKKDLSESNKEKETITKRLNANSNKEIFEIVSDVNSKGKNDNEAIKKNSLNALKEKSQYQIKKIQFSEMKLII